jgi:hypothetical protein
VNVYCQYDYLNKDDTDFFTIVKKVHEHKAQNAINPMKQANIIKNDFFIQTLLYFRYWVLGIRF